MVNKKQLQKPKVTPIQLIIWLGAIIVVIITSTDMVRTLIVIGFQTLQVLSGIPLGDLKYIFTTLLDIMKDPQTKLEEKLKRVMEFVLVGSAVAGEIYEHINVLQGTNFRSEEQKKL